MPFRNTVRRSLSLCLAAAFIAFATLAVTPARAQDNDNPAPEKHGRKYKAPPETSHIEVTVLKGFNKKPIMNAAVVFHPMKDGKDEGNLEMKTDPEGKAIIDVIPTGSSLRIQVIADGFATYAQDYLVTEPSREIVISMIRPRAQVSTYIDNTGKAAQIKPGVQEPVRPKKSSSPAPDASSTSGSKPQP